ncbi:U3 small nucleolar ribonucleoprotein protein MPP10-like [Macrobrachium rosenbergii]|uniref:U3 small nucleolar ribonucleoprotein protein MPP10-like n=1 Tax=Macrobrachium rosenbergii TaxID=79674 RepID=UPI0034D6FFFA
MENLIKKTLELLKNHEEYLRPSDKFHSWAEQTGKLYNFVKDVEVKYSLPVSGDTLPCLNTEGLDVEQIWQLLELQNKSLLAAPDDLDVLDDVNLCFNVAKLSSLAKYDKFFENKAESKDEDSVDDGVFSESDSENEKAMEEGSDYASEGEESSRMFESSDEELFKEPSNIDGGLNLVFDDDSDNEEDNFDELIAPEGMEDSDEDEQPSRTLKKSDTKLHEDSNEKLEKKEKAVEEEVKKQGDKHKKFKKTEVDSEFFSLRECEWVADNDAIGDNYDMDSDDIDLMKDTSDGESEDGVMYEAFFGGEKGEFTKSSQLKEDEDSDSDALNSEDGGNEDPIGNKKKNFLDDSSEESEKEVTQLLGLKKKEEKSTFEKDRERELMLMSTLEEDNVAEKPWFLKGEAVSADRPENSTLEEQLEYNIAARQRPVITEDTTTLVEKIILSRIRSKAWDDVVRKVKPNITPFEYKKKLLLNQEKSKKSLAEIYEEEYLKQQKKNEVKEKKEEELPEHKEISEKMDYLFSLLDALTNYHYTPKMVAPDVKIQSNLPAITMEEATPVTASEGTLLAPQEVLASVQGELKGKSELTDTDRKRSRRAKKAIQKKKSKIQTKKLQAKLKKSEATGKKLDMKTTIKFVEKAVKAKQVKLLESKENKAIRSSQAFFKRLQDTKNSGDKKSPVKKKKSEGKTSASKVLL